MADDDKAAREASEKRIKELFKESMTEWLTEQQATRTQQQQPKKNGGLFDALFGA